MEVGEECIMFPINEIIAVVPWGMRLVELYLVDDVHCWLGISCPYKAVHVKPQVWCYGVCTTLTCLVSLIYDGYTSHL